MEQESLSDLMIGFADRAVAYAGDGFQLELDYSEASLSNVEQILDAFAQHLDELRPDFRNEIQLVFGAYVGEVIRRRWGGEWTRETPLGTTLSLQTKNQYLFPTGKVGKRIENGPEDSITFYYLALVQAVEKGS